MDQCSPRPQTAPYPWALGYKLWYPAYVDSATRIDPAGTAMAQSIVSGSSIHLPARLLPCTSVSALALLPMRPMQRSCTFITGPRLATPCSPLPRS